MTGNQKIETVASRIKAKHESLISGNVVTQRSEAFMPHILANEQLEILDLLAARGLISFKVQENDEDPDHILASKTYTITVLGDLSHIVPSQEVPVVTFNPVSGLLTSDGTSVQVPDETLRFYVCKLVFANTTVPVLEQDIIEAAGVGDNSIRAVYDATRAVNELIESSFGIRNYLLFRAGKVRVNPSS